MNKSRAKAIVNDDLSALEDIAPAMGQAAAKKQNDALKKENCALQSENQLLREIESNIDRVSAEWSCMLQATEEQRDRLLVLATKWCDRDHHDWNEILKIAKSVENNC